MKKYLLILLLLITINLPVCAQMSEREVLSAIENTLFGYNYADETEVKRVERIEQNIYGEKKKGSVSKRLEEIQNDTGLLFKKEVPAVKEQKNNDMAQNSKLPVLKEDSTVEYPLVDKMEEDLFRTTYKKENIYARLDRLEDKVFGKKSTEDLSTRVDKLSSILHPQARTVRQEDYSNYSAKDMDDYYAKSGFDSVDDQSVPFQLAALEEDIFKNVYSNENNSRRLSRLEQKIFNRTFTNDADIARVQRIIVAYDAKKNSYKYENNKKMQNMATASQIGGILLMILAILL